MREFKIVLIFLLFGFTTFAQVKYDTVYTKTFENGGFNAGGYSVLEHAKDSLLLSTGISGQYCGYVPLLLITNLSGDTIWSKKGIPGNGKIVKSFDGNYLNLRTVNNADSDCYMDTMLICKFDIKGNIYWEKKYVFGLCNNIADDIIETSDSGLVALCTYSITNCISSQFYNSVLVKLDKKGKQIWIKYLGWSKQYCRSSSVVQTSNGDLYILSYVQNETYKRSYRILKTDSEGNDIWESIILTNENISGQCDITLLPNDELFFAGNKFDQGVIARINQDGEVKMIKYFDSSISGFQHPQNVFYIPDKNACMYVSDKIVICDTTGNTLWNSFFMGLNMRILDITELSNKDIMVIGVNYTNNKEKTYLIRFSEDPTTSIINSDNNENLKFYPNPMFTSATLEFDNIKKEHYQLKIFNSNLQMLFTINDITQNSVKIDNQNLVHGMYFFQLSSEGGELHSGKFIVK